MSPWGAGARARSHLLPAVVLALLGQIAVASPSPAATQRAPLSPGVVAALSDTGELFVQALPRRGEAMSQMARRLCGSAAAVDEIARANRGARRLLAGVRYRIPYDILRGDLQVEVVRALFVKDHAEPAGWRHVAVDLGRGRTPALESVAEWFTGRLENAKTLRATNHLGAGPVPPGAEILVAAELLRAPFRSLLPAARPAPTPRAVAPAARPVPSPAPLASSTPRAIASISPEAAEPPPPTSPAPATVSESTPSPLVPVAAPPSPVEIATPTPASALTLGTPTPAETVQGYPLDYGKDEKGGYAVYRLRPGEALYSSVVVRFTGQLQAEDVIALAREIAERSGIADVTDIAIGYPVKIPRDMLLPEFLPFDDPKRIEYEAKLSESAKFRNQVTAAGLEGVTVVLDAGHGGADVGASVDGIWESLYVYDIVQRVVALLEGRTLAKVHVTTRDGDDPGVVDQDLLPLSRGHRVLTRPPYRIEDSKVGVHLRWYLANSLFRKAIAVGRGASDAKAVERVVFISVHADSLHPSLRGATVYIPAAERTAGSFRKIGPQFESRQEVREAPTVEFSRRDRVRSEGLSRQLGLRIVESFRDAGLAVHPYKPVRDSIIRNRRMWVPAVLRYNAVPAKVLLEVCNLSNPEDRRLLRNRSFRQQVAEATVAALLAYYGPAPAASHPPATAPRAAR